MHREILISCLPFLVAICLSVLILRLLVAVSGARPQLPQLMNLHRDEVGGVQSLSFVLTLPLFIMILMFIVQLSQLTIAKVVVEYAAFVAARSAIVWIPANEDTDQEWANQIGVYRQFLRDEAGENNINYSIYEISGETAKYEKIHLAAAMACMPICPSRDLVTHSDHSGNGAFESLLRVYRAMSPASDENPRIANRIQNKLQYALANTGVRIEVHHKDEISRRVTEPPLMYHDIGPYREEFAPNEIGWQDQVHVTVTHNFALLPGPGRLLAKRAEPSPTYSEYQTPMVDPAQRDRVADRVGQSENGYVYPISATVRLQNEGQKSVLPYLQSLIGMPQYVRPEDPQEDDEPEYQFVDPVDDDESRFGFGDPLQ